MDAAQLRRKLHNIGLSQRQSARELGIDERTMRRYCLGETEVPRMLELALEGLRMRVNAGEV